MKRKKITRIKKTQKINKAIRDISKHSTDSVTKIKYTSLMGEVSLPVENNGKNQDMIERSPDGFVAVDIGALSSKTEHMENSSSRKGYQRNGEENTTDGLREDEKEVTLVHVAQAGGPSEVFRVTTPRIGGKCKRSSRRRSTWLGPRNVLFVFAALSSMGTLILLYFTLSIAKSTTNQMDNQ